jgi:hypothetical protein
MNSASIASLYWVDVVHLHRQPTGSSWLERQQRKLLWPRDYRDVLNLFLSQLYPAKHHFHI